MKCERITNHCWQSGPYMIAAVKVMGEWRWVLSHKTDRIGNYLFSDEAKQAAEAHARKLGDGETVDNARTVGPDAALSRQVPHE